jgi:hypothetical protein
LIIDCLGRAGGGCDAVDGHGTGGHAVCVFNLALCGLSR